jgi:hypothetical protein
MIAVFGAVPAYNLPSILVQYLYIIFHLWTLWSECYYSQENGCTIMLFDMVYSEFYLTVGFIWVITLMVVFGYQILEATVYGCIIFNTWSYVTG